LVECRPKEAALARAGGSPCQRKGEARCWRSASALLGPIPRCPSNECGESAGNGRVHLPRKRHEQARGADGLGAQLGNPEQIREMDAEPPGDAGHARQVWVRRPFSTPPIKLGVSPATSAKASRVQPRAKRRRLTSRPKATTCSSVATVTPLIGVVVALFAVPEDAPRCVPRDVIGRAGHRAEHLGRFCDGEHDALPALAAGDVDAFDVRDGKQHPAIAPQRQGRNDVGRVAILEAMLEALEALAELAELREDGREGPSDSVHPFQNG